MKIKRALVLCLAMIFLGTALIPAALAVNSPKLLIETITGGNCVGDEIVVPVALQENPGLVSLRVRLTYDETVLQLLEITDSNLLNGMTQPTVPFASGMVLRWADSYATEDNTANGTIVQLRFKVLAAATSDICVNLVEAFAQNGTAVSFADAQESIQTQPAAVSGLSLGSASGGVRVGDTVQIPLQLHDNAGLVSLRVQLHYDTDVLKLTQVENAGLLQGFTTPTAPADGMLLRWADAYATEDNAANGTIATLYFEVIAAGETEVTVDFVEAHNVENDAEITMQSASVPLTASAHSYGELTVVYDDCEHGKVLARFCTVEGCGEEKAESRVVERDPGHDLQYHDAKAPTCTESGWNAYDTCSRCDYTTRVDLEKTEHTPGEWVVDVEPTDTAVGHRHIACVVCGTVLQEEDIPMTEWNNPFKDVAKKNWFYASVRYVAQNGIFHGTSKVTFEPNTPMNRAMFCRVLANLEHVDDNNAVIVTAFSDVASGLWYTKAVKWGYESGVISGYPDGTFKPMQAISRQEMCVMLKQYAVYKGLYQAMKEKPDNGLQFADAKKIPKWSSEAVNVMKNNGYIVGKNVGGAYYFEPKALATRAEVATIFKAFCEANPSILQQP